MSNMGDTVIVSANTLQKYCTTPYMGPYKERKVIESGALKLQMGGMLDTINIWHTQQYQEQ